MPSTKLEAAITEEVRKKAIKDGMTPQQYGELKDHVTRLVDAALDRNDPLDPNSTSYNVIGEIRAYESLRTLMFSGVASVPEMGVAFNRAKGEIGATEFTRVVYDTIKNGDEAIEFARAIGAVRDEMGAAMMTEMWSPWDGPGGKFRLFRNALPHMFRLNGNDSIVKYSRAIALRTGVHFIKESAQKASEGSARHQRYLRELGLEPQDVFNWMTAASRSSESAATVGNDKIRDALNMFIDDTVLRPNSAERPTFARHPLGTFVFHLKTFAYSYNKKVVGGMIREVESRYGEADSKTQAALDAIAYMAPMLMVMTLFGAMSDEMRERIKSLGANGTWGAHDGVVDTLASAVDRTGIFTSMPFFDPIWDTVTGNPSASSYAFGLGPTASHLYDFFGDGKGVSRNELVRSIPGVSQTPALKQALYS